MVRATHQLLDLLDVRTDPRSVLMASFSSLVMFGDGPRNEIDGGDCTGTANGRKDRTFSGGGVAFRSESGLRPERAARGRCPRRGA